MKKNVLLILSSIFPMMAFGAPDASMVKIEKPVSNETTKEKSLYEKLSEKGRGDIMESAEGGRTGGNSNCVKSEK